MKIAQLYTLYKKRYLVDTDTRAIRQNSIFFALKGDNFNGNKFAKDALKAGASYAIIDEPRFKIDDKTILVDNVLDTLQLLAKYHRKQLTAPIIALTGSNGKTTTKELINAVLSTKYQTTATLGNLNNHIGVPLTLLSMTPKTAVGIVEMGANHQKEIAFLCTIALPDFGYITNFGKAHLEGFGGVDGVVKGKSELYNFLRDHGKTAFINPTDSIQLEKSKDITNVRFPNTLQFVDATPFVNLALDGTVVKSNLIGTYNYDNIAAAITIGTYFDVEKKAIKKAIENYVPTNNRSQVIEKEYNSILLDAYNANPSSMKVALENFVQMKSSQKTVILGDMFELGKDSEIEHQYIADLADTLSFSNTLYVGNHFYKTTSKNKKFKTYESLQNYIIEKKLKNQTILIKGSRGMQLERILPFID